MENILNCFGNIVGTLQDRPSDSGLYITDLEAVSTIESLMKEDVPEDLDDRLEDARRIAILKLHTDLTTLMMRYAEPRSGFKGVIGSNKYSGDITETGLSGIRILCRKIQDAELVIHGINTLFAATGVVQVHLASNYSDEVEDIDLNTTANRVNVNRLPESIVLPLYTDESEGEYVEYYIYHDNTMTPKNNRIQCSTCNKFYFDAARPVFKEYGQKQYTNIGGFNIDSLENLTDAANNFMRGLQVNMEIRCRTDYSICKDSIDFLTNPLAMSYAVAIQYKAGSVLVWDITRNPALNRVTMQNIEDLRDAASYYERKYNDMVKYISENMQIESDCFCLKSKQRIRRP